MSSQRAPNNETMELDEFGLPKANPSPISIQKEGFLEKCKREPLVPLFALGTVGVLGYGLFSFQKGSVGASQRAMRMRVLAQGATIFAMIGYLGAVGDGPIGEIMKAWRERKVNNAPAGSSPQ